jgi:hypothetical protein
MAGEEFGQVECRKKEDVEKTASGLVDLGVLF